jgi:hypothetical protein
MKAADPPNRQQHLSTKPQGVTVHRDTPLYKIQDNRARQARYCPARYLCLATTPDRALPIQLPYTFPATLQPQTGPYQSNCHTPSQQLLNPRQGPTNPTAIRLPSNPSSPDRALPIQLPYAFPATLSYISRRTKQQVANLTQLWLCLVTAVKLVLRTQRRRPVSVGEGFEGGRYQFA